MEQHGRAYGYDATAGGRALGRRERTIYREAVLAAEARGTKHPPNPFDPSSIDQFERLIEILLAPLAIAGGTEAT